jgi:DNA-binding IclR family transcriptional regulator
VAGPLPENVARFLDRYVDSVDQVEILLLLRADASRRWSAREIGARMRRPEAAVAARLELMLSQKLVERAGGDRYRYSPGRHDAAVDAVEQCFAIRRPAVIAAIFAER